MVPFLIICIVLFPVVSWLKIDHVEFLKFCGLIFLAKVLYIYLCTAF